MKSASSKFVKVGLFSLICFAICDVAQATSFTFSGTITGVHIHDKRYGTDFDWFSLSSYTTAAGNCAGGPIRIRDDIKGQRMYKALLLAESVGKTVTVFMDDSIRDANGYCYLDYMSM